MKKKLAMRIASLALCVVFVGALFAAPKAKAVAVEAAAVSIGAAVLSSYLIATNMDLIGDTAETISNGISSLVSDWVTASGVADSGDSWLSSLGTAVSVSNPGVLIVPGALAAGCAAFVSWLTETFGLDEDGKEAVVIEGNAGEFLFGNVELPGLPYYDQSIYSYAFIICNVTSSGTSYSFYARSRPTVVSSSHSNIFDVSGPCSEVYILFSGGSWGVPYYSQLSSGQSWTVTMKSGVDSFVWSNFDIMRSGEVWYSSSVPIPVGDVVGQFGLTRVTGFANIANNAEEADELAIYTALPGVTLEELAADIPAQIAAGTLAPTAELTQTGEGSGEGEGTDDDVIGGDSTTVGLLQSILNGVKAIPESISTSIADVFTPSQEAVDNLASEVDTKLPFIPVLKDFGSDLVYNLEHPEACADGLGLTTVVDLGKGRGIYLGDTTHDLLDVSWYLEYKPLVDDLIVGFCWLVFLWNCYGALPRIIHGEGSTITVNAMDFPTVNDGSLSQKSLGPSDGSSWGPDGKWKMW